jgi:hypothetical protein
MAATCPPFQETTVGVTINTRPHPASLPCHTKKEEAQPESSLIPSYAIPVALSPFAVCVVATIRRWREETMAETCPPLQETMMGETVNMLPHPAFLPLPFKRKRERNQCRCWLLPPPAQSPLPLLFLCPRHCNHTTTAGRGNDSSMPPLLRDNNKGNC